MADVSLKLSAKDIYEKDFEKTMARGYRREEVDAFLDDIITDYQKMADMNNEVVKLSEENNKLKKEVEETKTKSKKKDTDEKIEVINNADIDPTETKEWIESLSAVLDNDGKNRAQFLIKSYQ